MAEYLIQNNIKPSFQRIKIFEYIINNNHPTVDQIHKQIVFDIPTLSKTTVYNTVTLFLKSKILSAVYIEENTIRYDSNLCDHGHFKCKKCEKIYDFEVSLDEFKMRYLDKFQIHEKDLYLKGLCPECT